MRTLLFGLCVVFGAVMCDTASAKCKDCDKGDRVVIVRPFARVVEVRKGDTVIVDRPLLWPFGRVIVVRGK